jgi:hypothetical protein
VLRCWYAVSVLVGVTPLLLFGIFVATPKSCCGSAYVLFIFPLPFKKTTVESQPLSLIHLFVATLALYAATYVLFLEFGCCCSLSLGLVLRWGCFCTAIGWWLSFDWIWA